MNHIERAKSIFTHYLTINPQSSHYYGLVALYGMVNLCEASGDTDSVELTKRLLDAFPDRVEHPRYNFPSYRVGGIAKARAVYTGLLSGDEYERQLAAYADELMSARRSHEGILSMPHGDNPDKVWIDVATAATPFLLFSGLHLGRGEYIDEAAFQTLAMYDLFLDKSCGLLHQSRDFCGEGRLSDDHWSRGNGWGILPLAELCAHLPENHPERGRCIEYFKAHIDSLAKYQSQNGMWRQEITVESLDTHSELGILESYEETSGTGLILYAMGVGIRNGLLDRNEYLPIFKRGIDGLYKVSISEDDSIVNSCPGCLCPGDGTILAYLNHRRTFRDEPHGAGPVILALSEAARLGV